MSNHISRIREEKEALQIKIGKLEVFINSDQINTLSDKNQWLLAAQVSSMMSYLSILELRLLEC